MRWRFHALRRAVLVAAVACPAASVVANTSTWTGAAGDLLWSNPANWSDGVPLADTDAVIPAIPVATIDLGGLSRSVDSLSTASSVTLANGTLAANQIITQNNTLSPPTVVAASVTSAGPVLRLSSNPRGTDLRVDGPITGSGFDLIAGGVLAGPSTYTGRTIISLYRPLTFQDAGSARNSSAYDVGFRLNLRNDTTASDDRLNDAAPVRLYASELRFFGTADLPVTERVGSVELMRGASTLTLPAGSSLRAGDLVQHPGATLTVARASAAAGTLLLDVAPTLIGGPAVPGTSRPVVPFVLAGEASGGNPSLTTYDGGGLRALDPDAEFDQALPATPASPAPNVRLPVLTTTSSPATVNALIIDQGLTLQDAVTLTVNSGAILFRGTTAKITGNGSLVSPSDLFVYTNNVSAALDVPVHAPSLTVTGQAYLSHPNDISSLTVNGDLHLSDPRALGSGPVRVGGSIAFQGTGSYTVPNDISLGPLYRPLDTPPAPYGFLDYRITLTLGRTITLAGHLTGDSDGYVLNGDGTLRLDGEATFASLNLATSSHATLEVNGTLSSDHPDPAARATAITLAGRIRGNGTILGAVWSGDVSPGPDGLPGRLTVADLYSYVGSGLNVSLDLAGLSPGQDYDQLVVLRSFPQDDGEFPTLTADLTFAPPLGTEFLVVDFQGNPGFAPHFLNLPEGAALLASNGTPLRISYLAGDGNDVSLTVVPEPVASPFLLAVAGAAATTVRRR